MAHESFENDEVAELVNDSVRRDQGGPRGTNRSRKPYTLTATQELTGQCGWPMNGLATPDGVPSTPAPTTAPTSFECVRAIGKRWQDQRDDVVAQGDAIVEAGGRAQGAAMRARPGRSNADLLDAAAAQWPRIRPDVRRIRTCPPKFRAPGDASCCDANQRTGT